MSKKLQKVFHQRWLPWILLGGTLTIALLIEIIQPAWIRALPKTNQVALWGVALVTLALIYFITGRMARLSVEFQQLQHQVEEAERMVAVARQRQEVVFRVNQKSVEATDENEVVELVLQLSLELVGAAGASFVALDEHGQPFTVSSHGEIPSAVTESWLQYLASPVVRERCKTCENHNNITTACPLLNGPILDAKGIFCLPVRRGEHEFGVLNLFLPHAEQMDAETTAFLRVMMDETALALEGVSLRRRELQALQQMQAIRREKTELSTLLSSLLGNVLETLEADFAILVVPEAAGCQINANLTQGDFPNHARPFINGILQGVLVSGEPVLLGDVEGNSAAKFGVRTLMAAPLMIPDRSAFGALLVGNRRQQGFHQRQLALLQTIAGQAALVVQTANLIAELEYKTMIQERTRLAREIHDGLAQTLGFLKLQVSQMQNYLEREDLPRLRQSLDQCYAALSDAYQEARQAIDGLRIWPDEQGLSGWLEQTVEEFRELTGLPVIIEILDVHNDLPPEVHAQLIRIVQEALSNVRKHSQAERVWIACREDENDLCLEIRDNGKGFAPEYASNPSRHGLRGMRERADLIGADYQITSQPNEGTQICIRLPLKGLRMKEVS